MGISGSSLLDESKSASIRGEAEAELRRFTPFYRRQFFVARFCQAQNDVEQLREQTTQLLKQKAPPEGGEVLYEDALFYFDETRKWRERYVVMRANYILECHENIETFLKGAPPHHRLLPTGGAVLTTEERYMELVDRCFPDDSSAQEDFAPPLSSMPGQFPVYLRLPYRRDSYFCFKQQQRQEKFLSALTSCVRHQNQDFLKKSSFEVKGFVKAVQFYRESQGSYGNWDMLIGSDVRVLSNSVMERLLVVLEKDLLPKLKAKKNEKKRVWFATVEAAYVLVQETLLEGLSSLKDELRTSLRQKEVQIHSDMDQIQRSREQLKERVQAVVVPPAEGLVSQEVQPYLSSVLEELMEPVSRGFSQGRELCAGMMDQVREEVLRGVDRETLREALLSMSRPRLEDSFHSIGFLEERLKRLRDRFGFKNLTGVVHSVQIDLQQLMENAAFTFETLLHKVLEDDQDDAASSIDKARHRVLKQFDYDSSSMRKRICEEALVQITLPYLKEHLQEQRKQLKDAEENVPLDHCDFIDIENIYQDVLLSILHKEVSRVLKEAVSLQKYNLFNDSRDLLSHSSLSSTGSAPASPALSSASSLCASNHGLSPATLPHTPTGTQEARGAADLAGAQTVETNGDKMAAVAGNTNPESVANGRQEAKVMVEEISDISEETGNEIQLKTQEKEANKMVKNAETLVTKEVNDAHPAENNTMSKLGENVQEAAQIVAGAETSELPDEVFDQKEEKEESETAKVQKQEVTPATNEEILKLKTEMNLESQSPGEKFEENVSNEAVENRGEDKVTAKNDSENKMAENRDVGEAPESETGNAQGQEVQGQEVQGQEVQGQAAVLSGGEEEEEGSDDEGSTTSDVLEENSQSPLSSEEVDQWEERSRVAPEISEEPERPLEGGEGEERPLEGGEGEERPLDCIRVIRELVQEVIEVEDLAQRYPSGVPVEVQSPDQDQD
ncbi:protein Niban 1-like [Periophthalmus magnuspinnatus]|uniref:protein Niban 1-like n=1 Tax=Periophthalmus magnuspinnatus TaxID=409849 RepID=UPI002436D0FB|nr:protein Niban 1-like [Periophthalmus magnuspinnatus]